MILQNYFKLTPIILLLAGCSGHKIYLAEYSNISISPISINEKHDLSIWETVDTSNINTNNFIVVIEKVKCYSNNDFSYFISTTINSNIETENSTVDEILLDKKNGIIYLINERIAFNCEKHELEMVKTLINDSTYSIEINKGNDKAIITFNSNVSKALSSKFVSNKIENGVSEIISPKQKIKLLNYSQQDEFDFKTVISKAKKECVLNKKKINLIFPGM
jgi:hypothetical protein